MYCETMLIYISYVYIYIYIYIYTYIHTYISHLGTDDVKDRDGHEHTVEHVPRVLVVLLEA